MDDWLTLAMEEYRTIRAEILDSIKIQHTILQYGMTVISAIALAGFSVWKTHPVVAIAVFLGLLPVTISFIGITWAGEVGRMFRAGSFLLVREHQISSHVCAVSVSPEQPPALVWETWASGRYSFDKSPLEPSPQQRLMLYNRTTFGYLALCALSCVVLGIDLLWKMNVPWGYIVLVGSSALAVLGCVIRAMVNLTMVYQKYICDSSFWPPL